MGTLISLSNELEADRTITLDYQNRVGSKFGGGGVARADEAAIDRRERLRKLALETIDLAKVRLPFSLPSFRP
jgi:hypothetical protein